MQQKKLALSSLEFILIILSGKEIKFAMNVEEAKKCAEIVFAIVDGLSTSIKNFERERTLTETIFHQMIRYCFVFSSSENLIDTSVVI